MENSSAPRVLEIDGVVYRLIYSGENNLSLEPVESSASTSASAGSSGSIRGGPDSCKQQSKGSLKRVRREAAAVDEEDDDDDDDEEDEEDEVDDEDVESRVPHKKEPRKKRKRTSWNSEEIEKLIDILIEKHIVDKLDGKCGRLRHNEIFKSVVKALNAAKLGPQKDVSNCRIKYKKLKEGFFDCVKNNSTSGQNRVSIPYYDKLSVLFSKRPRNSICDWGYDSKFDAGNSENMDPASAATAQLPEGTEERGSESLEGVLTTSGRMMAVSNPATSESPAHKRFPPKYRSGAAKKNTSHMLLKEIMEKSETEAKEFKVWTDQRMAAAEERDEKMLKSFTAAISSSMENMAKILQPQPHQQQHTQYMPGMPFVSQQALWIALQSTLASNAASSLPPHIQVEGPTGAPSSSALPASFFAGQESKINSEARGASPASAAQISGAAAIRPGVVSTPATAAQISGAAAIRPGVASTPATAAQISGAAAIRPGVVSTPATAAQISGAAAIRPGVASTPATAAQISGAAAIRPGVVSTPATAAQISGAAAIRPGVASTPASAAQISGAAAIRPGVASTPATAAQISGAAAIRPGVASTPASAAQISGAAAIRPGVASTPATAAQISGAAAIRPGVASAPATAAQISGAAAIRPGVASAPATAAQIRGAALIRPGVASTPATAAQIRGAALIRPGVASTPATAAQIRGAAAIRPGVASTPATAAQIRGAALIRPGVASRHPTPLQAIILKPRVAGKTNAVPVSLGVHLQGTFPQSTAQSGSTQAVRFVVSSSSTPPK